MTLALPLFDKTSAAMVPTPPDPMRIIFKILGVIPSPYFRIVSSMMDVICILSSLCETARKFVNGRSI